MSIQGQNDLLGKINALQQKQVTSPKPTTETDGGFGNILQDAFEDINKLQGEATTSVEKLLAGETKDVDQVMNKVAEAGVAFDLMLEVKSKVIEAYKQMERMQI